MGETDEEVNKVREDTVKNMEAMENAMQPPIMLIINPVIEVIDVTAGSRLKKKEQQLNQSS